MSLRSLDDVTRALDALPAGGPGAGDDLARALVHCAQSIEYSLVGYPALRSPVFRATVGKLAKRAFLRRGRMKHDTGAPIPGAPAPQPVPVPEAAARLRRAIEAFRGHDGPLAPHLAYGACTRAEYDALHALHVADHLAALGVVASPAPAR